jgi:hypothetical protein
LKTRDYPAKPDQRALAHEQNGSIPEAIDIISGGCLATLIIVETLHPLQRRKTQRADFTLSDRKIESVPAEARARALRFTVPRARVH